MQAHQKVIDSEEMCRKLSTTIEKMLIESNERSKHHVEEKTSSMKEKVFFKFLFKNVEISFDYAMLRHCFVCLVTRLSMSVSVPF